MVLRCQLAIIRKAGVPRDLHDQLTPVCNGKPPRLMEVFVGTVCKFEHHYGISSLGLVYELHVRHPRQWMKQALNTLEEPMELYMVEVIAESHVWQQQHICSWFSTC